MARTNLAFRPARPGRVTPGAGNIDHSQGRLAPTHRFKAMPGGWKSFPGPLKGPLALGQPSLYPRAPGVPQKEELG